ncbi:MAG: hypothetical protein JNK31_05615 [Candidatus Competibacter sp.]|nr:hypothetical protein [Candidatus Competibacter sp.]
MVETAKWLGIDPYSVLTRIAERVAPGAEGLLFHPPPSSAGCPPPAPAPPASPAH